MRPTAGGGDPAGWIGTEGTVYQFASARPVQGQSVLERTRNHGFGEK